MDSSFIAGRYLNGCKTKKVYEVAQEELPVVDCSRLLRPSPRTRTKPHLKLFANSCHWPAMIGLPKVSKTALSPHFKKKRIMISEYTLKEDPYLVICKAKTIVDIKRSTIQPYKKGETKLPRRTTAAEGP